MVTETTVLEILSSTLGIPQDELVEEEEISMASLPEWDSLSHTQIILALESQAGTRFNTSEASQAHSLAALLELSKA